MNENSVLIGCKEPIVISGKMLEAGENAFNEKMPDYAEYPFIGPEFLVMAVLQAVFQAGNIPLEIESTQSK